jgi:hypothetical protein
LLLAELARRLNKATATVYGWADTGVIVNGQRVKLATARVGGRRHVTAAAWRAFKAACNPEQVPVPESPAKATRRAKTAKDRVSKLLSA